MTTPTLPTIHFNGSSAERLYELARAAELALDAALNALCDAHPHGRDYYPQGADAYNDAAREATAHREAVRAARDYWQSHALHALDALTPSRPSFRTLDAASHAVAHLAD